MLRGCVKEGYILGNFKLPLRYKEHMDYEQKMRELGIPVIARVEHGLFEGGDFAFLNETTIAVGMADRTNETGVEEIRTQLAPYGYRVIGVPLNPAYLHLDMCFNLVDDHLAVAYYNGLPDAFREELKKLEVKIIPVSEEAIFAHGCNLQALGNHRVISLSRNKEVNREMEKNGMDVIELPITEILKAGGGPHCMELRRAIGGIFGFGPEQVFVGNGADEVLGFCMLSFFKSGMKICFPDITYDFYRTYAKTYRLDFKQFPLKEDFTVNVEDCNH